MKYNEIDLLGKRFKKLQVLKKLGFKNSYNQWECLCDCGKKITTSSYNLIKGLSGSCGISGCSGNNHQTDLVGKQFGKLKIVSFSHSKNGQRIWNCICVCGKTKKLSSNKLLSGKRNHCGCENIKYKDRSIPVKKGLFYLYKKRMEKKGLSFSISFDNFCQIISSNCYYCGSPPNNIRYGNVNYRNKSVCVYNGIDRVNNNLGYTEENCVSCCFICNSAKGDLSTDEFTKWAKSLYKNIQEKFICEK
jgi:hypothetical protein